ncbi:ribokinase-like [Ischnura elegans]|uniref:ribokinase-like n=1 Tax=Ischnura elegans TaxID=197161 RepID=UPI001ED88579|nr:ribokinase-like [Ischnura elegans]
MDSKVVVLGSCMIDFSSYAPRLPKPGETLHGYKFVQGFGGKGANQCIAASRLCTRATLIARVGDDLFGTNYIKYLEETGIYTKFIKKTDDISSGIATIIVADSGENQIVIVAGANTKLSPEDVNEAADVIKNAPVLVCQFETPLETTLAALQMKKEAGTGISIVNAAPAVADVDPELLSSADIFCVNETEAEIMTGIKVDSVKSAEKAIKKFKELGCKTIIITLGAAGAVFNKEDEEIKHVAANKVTPVDTTGAGDAFIGALAYYLANHQNLTMEDVIKRSCNLATLSVATPGTQSSFPLRKDLPKYYFE